ncbi:MAG: hypothetical protein ACQERN_08565 [Thermodesulfobacteriota bacterium]
MILATEFKHRDVEALTNKAIHPECHACEGRHPEAFSRLQSWMPAFAGMTVEAKSFFRYLLASQNDFHLKLTNHFFPENHISLFRFLYCAGLPKNISF